MRCSCVGDDTMCMRRRGCDARASVTIRFRRRIVESIRTARTNVNERVDECVSTCSRVLTLSQTYGLLSARKSIVKVSAFRWASVWVSVLGAGSSISSQRPAARVEIREWPKNQPKMRQKNPCFAQVHGVPGIGDSRNAVQRRRADTCARTNRYGSCDGSRPTGTLPSKLRQRFSTLLIHDRRAHTLLAAHEAPSCPTSKMVRTARCTTKDFHS
jgi:hypothetical protein